jgi:hypothetical protein
LGSKVADDCFGRNRKTLRNRGNNNSISFGHLSICVITTRQTSISNDLLQLNVRGSSMKARKFDIWGTALTWEVAGSAASEAAAALPT